MKNWIYLIATAGILNAFGCSTANNTAHTASDSTAFSASNKAADSLEVKLSANQAITQDSVPVTFTVYNKMDTVGRFLKWETPFEPLLGKYLSVTDDAGTEANYKGPMAKRVMPPPADSYISVQPHDSMSVTFNLKKGYDIKPGKYQVKYNASGMSGLKATNQIKINVPEK
ncbi:protease [Mucilaginibacter sp. KACC 22063]|uniref:protease n=1 Tax=Mucilaginibacter sp. KACC 22063 TaxID=3025666 RepID=UPI002365912B|nr:protease [Mucilaginibacter sp. KACC 22063]WDF56696.1 protease [Mucilaginibacter sp. KACC 22063]